MPWGRDASDAGRLPRNTSPALPTGFPIVLVHFSTITKCLRLGNLVRKTSLFSAQLWRSQSMTLTSAWLRGEAPLWWEHMQERKHRAGQKDRTIPWLDSLFKKIYIFVFIAKASYRKRRRNRGQYHHIGVGASEIESLGDRPPLNLVWTCFPGRGLQEVGSAA